MQLFQQPFDAEQVKPQEAFEPVPEGWYVMAIRNSEAKPTKDNESGYLVFEIEVLEGEHKGRKIFDNLNLWNKSVQASEIAQRQLSAYCHATGVLVLTDSNQLHGIPLKAKIGIKSDPGYDPRNVVKAVKHIQEVTPGAVSAGTIPVAPFGQVPTLPAMPVAPTQSAFAPQAPAFPTPGVPAGFTTQQQPWAQQARAAAPAPTAGPVPPWRK
jgi:hypothetical protein